jgi:hypothetical protein
MLISCLGSETWSISSLLWVSFKWRDDEYETAVKENDDGGWSFDGVVLWLGRRQNEDIIEWWKK